MIIASCGHWLSKFLVHLPKTGAVAGDSKAEKEGFYTEIVATKTKIEGTETEMEGF